jgi:hypothetical protein
VASEYLRKWGGLGGIATRNRYGNDFYREIRKKRKRYLKGYITTKTKQRIRQQAIRQAKTEPNWAIAELWKAVAKNWEP